MAVVRSNTGSWLTQTCVQGRVPVLTGCGASGKFREHSGAMVHSPKEGEEGVHDGASILLIFQTGKLRS